MSCRVQNICERYPDYCFSISGMGEVPNDADKKLGKCSQMVCFVRKDMRELLSNGSSNVQSSSNDRPDTDVVFPINKFPYELLYRKEFPYDQDTRSAEEKIMDDVKYFINRHMYVDGNNHYYDEERDIFEIPVEHIFQFVHDVSDLNELRSIIRKQFEINEKDCIVEKMLQNSDFDESDNDYDYEDNDASKTNEHEYEKKQSLTNEDESWD